MTFDEHDELKDQLASVTTWTGPTPEPGLWQRALDADAQQKRGPFVFGRRMLNWSMPKTLAAGVVLVIGGSVVAAVLTQLDHSQRTTSVAMAKQWAAPDFSNAPGLDLNAAMNAHSVTGGYYEQDAGMRANSGVVEDSRIYRLKAKFEGSATDPPPANWNVGMMGYGSQGSGDGTAGVDVDGSGDATNANLYSLMAATNLFAPQSSDSHQSPDRSVVRKATIDLITKDVRISFAKAMLIVSEAGSEYIQDSGLSGAGKDAQGTLTLRVRAERLSEVLNQLRELGEVQSEKLTGEDVTAQIIDMESRLRNEQRVETELLELLEKRSDAPLKEILELRTHISSVRQTIEMLVAQRDRLSRFVSLATVLIIIRPEPTPVEEPKKEDEKTIGAYFGDSVSNSWHDGLRYLADAFAGTLRIIVGGLIWWVAAIALLLALRLHLQKRAMQ